MSIMIYLLFIHFDGFMDFLNAFYFSFVVGVVSSMTSLSMKCLYRICGSSGGLCESTNSMQTWSISLSSSEFNGSPLKHDINHYRLSGYYLLYC